MKICYITNGASLHMHRWLGYLIERGHEVHLISSMWTGGHESEIHHHQSMRPFPYQYKISSYLNKILWPWQVLKLVKQIDPDIVDASFITYNGYIAALSKFHPLVLTAWGSDILISPKNCIHRFFTRYSLKKADIVICDSETVRSALLKLGTHPLKIRKIFNGVDTRHFTPRKKNDELKSRLKLPEKAQIVVSIRNFEPVYNVEMFVKSIPLILKQMPETAFLIGGDGSLKGRIKELATSLDIMKAIRFTGTIPHKELPKYIATSDVYVSTSLSDSTSLSLQEAMACEVAPVVTDLPANREWVADGENGCIVPVNDVSALAEKIVYLLHNKAVREEFGKKGREIIKKRSEYNKEMAKVEELYQSLIN